MTHHATSRDLRNFLSKLFQTIIDFLYHEHSYYKSVITVLRSVLHFNLKSPNYHQSFSLITKLENKLSRETLPRLSRYTPPVDSFTSQTLVVISTEHTILHFYEGNSLWVFPYLDYKHQLSVVSLPHSQPLTGRACELAWKCAQVSSL